MSDHIKASEYLPGDRVRLVKKYTFNGTSGSSQAHDMTLGTMGTIQARQIQDQTHIGNDIIAVEYDGPDHGGWYTDASCLEPEQPMSVPERSGYHANERVRLIGDADWERVPVGGEGTVVEKYLEDRQTPPNRIVICWDDYSYGDSLADPPDNGHWTPVDRIELVPGPPTEEELAEVYKSLGVRSG